jgi:hypothetical protein
MKEQTELVEILTSISQIKTEKYAVACSSLDKRKLLMGASSNISGNLHLSFSTAAI